MSFGVAEVQDQGELDELQREFRRNRTLSSATNFGVWVTNAEGDGLVLLVPFRDGAGFERLFNRNGTAYGILFSEIADLAKQRREAREPPVEVNPAFGLPPVVIDGTVRSASATAAFRRRSVCAHSAEGPAEAQTGSRSFAPAPKIAGTSAHKPKWFIDFIGLFRTKTDIYGIWVPELPMSGLSALCELLEGSGAGRLIQELTVERVPNL